MPRRCGDCTERCSRFGRTRRASLREQTLALAEGFLSDLHKTQLNERGDADFAYANSFGRYRTSVVRQRLGVDLVFRIINTKVRTMDELGLPEHLKLLTRYQNGLILVTGSVGSGKSTTLAALVEQVNMERREHIITLEDPIEYVLEPKGCHITQREVHTHTRSFAAALRGALREDPDVIMVGEMRDLETISLAHHRRRDRAISFWERCIPAMLRAHSIDCSTSFHPINRNRSGSWSANRCVA